MALVFHSVLRSRPRGVVCHVVGLTKSCMICKTRIWYLNQHYWSRHGNLQEIARGDVTLFVRAAHDLRDAQVCKWGEYAAKYGKTYWPHCKLLHTPEHFIIAKNIQLIFVPIQWNQNNFPVLLSVYHRRVGRIMGLERWRSKRFKTLKHVRVGN